MKDALALPYSLASDIGCLLLFIRNCSSPDTFCEANSSSRVLNALLSEVKFELQSGNFIVSLKDKIKSKKAIAKKNTLSRFNLILDDPENGLPTKFTEAQWLDPGLTVKAALKKIIEQTNKETISRQIDHIVELLKIQTISLAGNENKVAEISSFFTILKNILVRESETQAHLSAEILILETEQLGSELDSIKNSILPLITNDITSDNISKASLFYARIAHSTKKHFPEKSESDIYNLLNTCIDEKINRRDEKQAYKAFSWGYQEKKPGFFILSGDQMSIYNEAKTIARRLQPIKEKYPELLQLIDKILDPILKETLYMAVDNYFPMQLSLEVNGNKDKLLENFKNFKNESESIIKSYIAANQPDSEQLTLLYKILRAIAKAIPNFIASKENINNFFFKRTPEGKKVVETEKCIHSTAPAA